MSCIWAILLADIHYRLDAFHNTLSHSSNLLEESLCIKYKVMDHSLHRHREIGRQKTDIMKQTHREGLFSVYFRDPFQYILATSPTPASSGWANVSGANVTRSQAVRIRHEVTSPIPGRQAYSTLRSLSVWIVPVAVSVLQSTHLQWLLTLLTTKILLIPWKTMFLRSLLVKQILEYQRSCGSNSMQWLGEKRLCICVYILAYWV